MREPPCLALGLPSLLEASFKPALISQHFSEQEPYVHGGVLCTGDVSMQLILVNFIKYFVHLPCFKNLFWLLKVLNDLFVYLLVWVCMGTHVTQSCVCHTLSVWAKESVLSFHLYVGLGDRIHAQAYRVSVFTH